MKPKLLGLKKKFALILIILIISSSSCKNENIVDHSIVKNNPVYNPQNPLKGEIELKLEKRIEIDPSKKNTPGELLFDNFWRDADGSVYIFDYKNFKIHKFDNNGVQIGIFLRKGEGPSEVLSYPQIQLSEHFLWVIADKKIIKFEKNGKFIKEYKLNNFYFSIQILDEENFIAFELNSLSKTGADNVYTKDLSIYELNTERCLKKIFSTPDTGRLYIKTGNRRMAVIPNPGIVPDIIYAFDGVRQRIYIAENKKYEIHVKDFNGDLKMTFSRPTANSLLFESDKRRIAEGITSISYFRKLIQDALPDQLCSIEKLFLFSNCNLGVFHIKGYDSFELDIFDPEGRFVYLVKFPGDFKPYKLKIYEDILGIIYERDDVMVYREYFIKSLKDILRST